MRTPAVLSYATIKVRYLDKPNGNGISWKIKDAEDNHWGLTAALAATVTQGSTIEIGYTERQSASGMTFRDIREIKPAAPAVVAGLAITDNDKARDIFLCGVVQNTMATGQYGIDDIGPITQAASRAWAEAHGAKPVAMIPATNGHASNGHAPVARVASGGWRGAQA